MNESTVFKCFVREDVLTISILFNRNAFTTLEFTTRAILGVVVSALAPTVRTFIEQEHFLSVFLISLSFILRNNGYVI